MRTQTLNDNSAASNPGGLILAPEKLRRFHPELYSKWSFLWRKLSRAQDYYRIHLSEHLLYGDSRAALVVCVEPLLVAAYTDELDCIALLAFPTELVSEYGLAVGSRLLTVNLYELGLHPVADLENGPASYHRYANFFPLIAEFLSYNIGRIENRKVAITEEEWARTAECARAYLARHGSIARDGRPLHSGKPALVRSEKR